MISDQTAFLSAGTKEPSVSETPELCQKLYQDRSLCDAVYDPDSASCCSVVPHRPADKHREGQKGHCDCDVILVVMSSKFRPLLVKISLVSILGVCVQYVLMRL